MCWGGGLFLLLCSRCHRRKRSMPPSGWKCILYYMYKYRCVFVRRFVKMYWNNQIILLLHGCGAKQISHHRLLLFSAPFLPLCRCLIVAIAAATTSCAREKDFQLIFLFFSEKFEWFLFSNLPNVEWEKRRAFCTHTQTHASTRNKSSATKAQKPVRLVTFVSSACVRRSFDRWWVVFRRHAKISL